MCGIAGLVAAEPLGAAGGVIHRMIDVQKHRGPDGQGFSKFEHAVLGHCRLAIVDLTDTGHQPMPDRERRYWITFNGEIYNHIELAEELRQLGHTFRGRCDTEVLLTAFREWGTACLDRLRGMFAFAIWDSHQQTLFAARDRLGIKPFHYCVRDGGKTLAFASELKALLEFVPQRRVNARLAGEFLAWNLLDHAPSETMLEDIWRLPAGHWLEWRAATGVSIRRYWELTVTERIHSSPPERERLAAEFRRRFSETIDLHLRSDVPVGSCLSGGLDSSAIVCAVAGQLKARRIDRPDWQQTFSACFVEPALDERPYMRAVADATGTSNHQVFPEGRRLSQEIDTWLWHQEEPVGGFGVYSQYCVARLAHEHGIKVLQDGQGADEQLLGYRKFIIAYVLQLLQSGHYMRAALEASCFSASRDLLATSSLAEGKRYLTRSVGDNGCLWPGGAPERPAGLRLSPPLGRRIQADLESFSLPVLLRFEDRNTMAFGLEARVPFVDHLFVEWMAELPADVRLRGGWTKRILRDALADLLPPAIRKRKSKLGFDTPDAAWLQGPMKEWFRDTLSRPVHLPSVVDQAGVRSLLVRHEQNRASPRTVSMLLRLALFEHWGGLFLTARCPPLSAADPLSGLPSRAEPAVYR